MYPISKNLIYLLSLIGFSSCSYENNHNDIVFPEVIQLECKEVIIKDVYLKYPFRIRSDNEYLYVTDLHPTDYYCHQFEYPSMKYKQGFAKRGSAPNEFLNVENIRVSRKSILWALDADKMNIVGFDQVQLNIPNYTLNLTQQLIRSLDFDIIDDSTFVVPDYTGESRLCFINHRGEIEKKSFTIPIQKKARSTPDIVIAQAWRSFLSYNPKSGVLAMATQLGQVIEIYDIKNDSIINIIHNKQIEPLFVTRGNYAIPIGIMGYSDIHVGAKNIYALFWGHSFTDLKNNKVEKEGGRFIHVFDLHGNPIRKYELDRYITGFCVDEERKKIMALDVNNNQPIIEYTYL